MRGEMKFMKKAQVYKAPNVEFNPSTFEATSYGWWHFVRLINGKVVYNCYNYSPSTCKHQQKVRSLLSKLDIKIDLIVETRSSLDESTALDKAIETEENCISELNEILSNPRRKKALDEKRQAEIAARKEKIDNIKRVMGQSELEIALA